MFTTIYLTWNWEVTELFLAIYLKFNVIQLQRNAKSGWPQFSREKIQELLKNYPDIQQLSSTFPKPIPAIIYHVLLAYLTVPASNKNWQKHKISTTKQVNKKNLKLESSVLTAEFSQFTSWKW